MLKIIFGRARSGKTYTLRNCLTEALRSGDGDVVLIVPEQFSFQSERDIIEELPPEFVKRVKVSSFTRLLDEVGRTCGGLAGKKLNAGIRTIMVARAARTVSQDIIAFQKQSNSISFAASVAETIAEFKQAGISSDKLREVYGAMTDCRLKWKLHDIALIMSAYDALIANVFIDPADDMARLGLMLERKKWFDGMQVFIDCFKGFTQGELDVLKKIIASAHSVTVTLPCDGPEETDEGAGLFSNVKKTANALIDMAKEHSVDVTFDVLPNSRYNSEELILLEKQLLSSDDAVYDKPTENISVCSAAYPADEINFVARTIKRLVREEGYRYRDFVVIARNIADYEEAAISAMCCYNVPLHIDSRVPAERQPMMVFALSAMEAAFSFDTSNVLRWLKTGLCGFTDDEIMELENYTFIWNISGKDWKEEWTRSPYGLEINRYKDEEEKLRSIETLRKRVVEKLQRFASRFTAGATEMAKALYHLTVECETAKHLSRIIERTEKSDRSVAEALRQSYSVFMDILSDIAECYRNSIISRDDFISAFRVALTEYDIGTVPMGIDEVLLGSADRIRTARPKVAFVLGVNQDVFPAIPSSDGLIAVRERKTLIDMGLPVSDRVIDASVDEMFMFYSAACCASDKVYFTYCSADTASVKREPSPYLSRLGRVFTNMRTYRENTGDGFAAKDIESFGSAKNCYAQTYFENSEFSASVKEYFDRFSPEITEGYNASAGQKEMRLTPDVARKLFGDKVYLSATRVDRFYSCPFSYFCRHGLNAKKPQRVEMNAMERGSLVHFVMERVLKEYGKNLDKLSDEELSNVINNLVDEYIVSVGAQQLEDHRWLILVGQVKELTKLLCREMGKQLADSDFDPVGLEIKLEKNGDILPVELPLSDGGKVVLDGQVDRVDRWSNGDNGYICVVDYKTGKKKFNISDVLYGLNMQMLLYLYSATLGGKYKGDIPAGILYIPSERNNKEYNGKGNEKMTATYSGLLLNDESVLTAMDNTKKGRYIPVKYNADGGMSADMQKIVLEQNEFELLFKAAENKLVQMGEELHNGNIKIDPLDSANGSACTYCDFRSVCRKENIEKNPKIENIGKEEVLNILKGGEQCGE